MFIEDNINRQNILEELLVMNIELRHQVRELTAFNEFSNHLSMCENLDDLIKIAVRTIREDMDFSSILVFLLDEDKKNIDLHPLSITEIQMPFHIDVESDEHFLHSVIFNHRSIIFNQNETHIIKIDENLLIQLKCSSFSAVPLRDGAGNYGLVLVGRSRDISSQEIKTLQNFVDKLSLAITTKKVSIISKQRIKELSTVHELSQAVNSNLGLNELLDIIVKMASDILYAERCSLMLFDEGGEELYIAAAKGMKKELIDSVRVKPGEGISGLVAKNGEPLLVRDIESDVAQKKKNQKKYNTKSLLTVPLRIHNEVIGVINVNNKKNRQVFTKSDMRLLSTFANSAAMAISNARLSEEMLNSERMATIGQMAGTIIHDIKGPMSVIKGYADFIGQQNTDYREYTNIIVREIDALVNMTQELLYFSKGKVCLELKDVFVDEFIDEVFEFFSFDVRAKKIVMEKDLQYSGLIKADFTRLKRVFFNIINNAIDATIQNGVIKVSTQEVDKWAEFRIMDNGKGIPEDLVGKVFDAFATFDKQNGTGLGLAIAKQIVESHDGEIFVTSEIGKGTEFLIRLPIE